MVIDGDNVRFHIDDKIYNGTIISSSRHGWFVAFSIGNSILFRILRLDKEEVYLKVLGYYPYSGDWPYCKTREDLIKILYYLDSLVNKNPLFIKLNYFV